MFSGAVTTSPASTLVFVTRAREMPCTASWRRCAVQRISTSEPISTPSPPCREKSI